MKLSILILLITSYSTLFAQGTPPPPPPVAVSSPSSNDTNNVIDFPDVEAQFKGGPEGMQKFIAENVVYPNEAIEKNEQGRVYLIFVVEKNGSITNIEVVRGVSEAINQEAIRLVASMPKWIPGEDEKQVARTNVRLPINFTLTNGNEEEPKKKKRRRR